MWTGCIGTLTPGISIGTFTSKVIAKPRSPEPKVPTKSGSDSLQGQAAVSLGRANPEGATADPGIEFPYGLMRRAPSDISMFTCGTELLWVRSRKPAGQLAAGLARLPGMDRKVAYCHP